MIHATICAPGAEMLRAFCTAHGVTVTAFLDGLSHILAAHESAPGILSALQFARLLDAERRGRAPS